MDYKDLLSPLPESLASRFRGLAGYVRVILEEEQDRILSNERLSSETLNDIQFVIVLIHLIQLLRESAKAASSAGRVFDSMGVAGFQIGSTTFTRGSESLNVGHRMADELSVILHKIDLPVTLTTEDGVTRMTRNLYAWVQKRG